MITYQDHFLQCYPNEGVGYVKDGQFFPLDNVSPHDKRHAFEVDPSFLLKEPDLLIHSHVTGIEIDTVDPRSPSYEDLEGQIKTGIEWAIVTTDGETCGDPVYWGNPDHRPALFGRDFIFGVQDCLALVQDWYYEERGVTLPNQPRTPFWNDEGKNYIEELYEQWGFKRIPIVEVERGDLLMYRVHSPVINHLGVYLGSNEVASHWYNRVSAIEPYGKWAGHIEFAARYAP